MAPARVLASAPMSDAVASALWLSLRVSVLATLVDAAVGIPLAYLLAKRRFRGRPALDVLITLPLVLPPTVTGYYLIVLLGRRGLARRPALRPDRVERDVHLVRGGDRGGGHGAAPAGADGAGGDRVR